MIHQHPRVIQPIDDLTVLAETLTQHTWTRCQGFSWNGLLFLNDSFSEDGAQEYAVVRNSVAIESLTVSWMTPEDLGAVATQLDTDPDPVTYGPCDAILETPPAHRRCRWCA